MITPAYSPTATERVLPRMALDFTTGVLDPRVTVIRASNTATRINSSGLVGIVNADLPRFDFDPITKVCKGLLIEESRINIQLQSEDFSTTWAATGISVSTNSTTAPDGNATADTLTASTSPGNIVYLQPVGNGTTYTFSLFVKKLTSDTVQINFSNVAAGPVFTFSTESFSTVASWTTSVQKLDNGWYRITATRASNTTFAGMQIRIANSGEAIYAWGAQVEAGAFATSYIPTVASQVTRNPDIATMTGTNFTSWYNSSEGAVFSEVTLSNLTQIQGPWAIGDNTLGFGSGRMMYVDSSPGASGKLTFNVFNNGSQQVFMQPNVIPVVGTPIRSVFAYKANSYAASVSAISPSTGSGSLPSVNGMSIGSLVSGWAGATQYLNGHVRKMSYWPQRLINAEVQAFSK